MGGSMEIEGLLAAFPSNRDGEELIVELVFASTKGAGEVEALVRAAVPDVPFEAREAFGNQAGDLWFVTFPDVSSDGHEPDGFEFARQLARDVGAVEGNLVPSDSLVGAAAAAGPEQAIMSGLCDTDSAEHPKAWPHRLIRVAEVWPHTRGAGVRIGHIDTGYSDHQELQDVFDLELQRNLIELDAPGDAADRFSTDVLIDHRGHGTVVASAVASRGNIQPDESTTGPGSITGIAPEAKLVPIRAIKSVINLRQSRLPAAIQHAIDCWWWTVFPARFFASLT